ncbi:Hypothetical predicted protein [Olea europaea subsp. europaea]|uniref:Uncharacterized protein n=1 Tax=Olea europaea subsp. europaea TaxID=158383 RepID=A0A8S0UQ63_OLEEU|nr:Hypothetical predicted protein [Olea europaea subsp. europaea]
MSSQSPEFEARQLSIPKPIHTLSPRITSLFYDPHSQSLALRHSDSSFSLYSSISPLSLSSIPPSSQILVQSPTSSATFFHLQTANSTATLFLTSSPLLRPSANTLFRFYLLRKPNDRFSSIRVFSSHGDLDFDENKFGVVFKVNHGVSVKLSGGINVFSMYSVSNLKIWVFAVRMVGDDGDGGVLKLMKCAVIDCCFPVFTMRVLSGYLILGEENGVRVFPLRPLVKGKLKKEKRVCKRLNLQNGLINGVDAATGFANSSGGKVPIAEEDLNLVSSKGGKTEKHSDSVKLRSVKLRQDSRDSGACFVAFKRDDVESSISVKMHGKSAKATSMQALSADKFLILDSVGDLHLLCLSYSVRGLEAACHMKQLTQTMKVIKLAVLRDVPSVEQTVWISDGHHTVHRMVMSGMDTSTDETKSKDNEEKLIQTSVTQAIFTSEKIHEVVPLAANAILILGEGSMFAYAIS